MAFEMQSKQEILARLKADLAEKLNEQSSVEGTFNSDTLSANAIEFEQAYAEINLMIEASFAHTSWGDYLTQKAAEFGVIRKEATKAVCKLLIKGTAGVQIIKGSLFATMLDVKFYSVQDETIGEDGTAFIEVECGEAGTIGNVEANTIVNIPMSIAGLTGCINEAAAYDGFEQENDKDLLYRYLLKVRTPATSGNVYHYYNWALSVEGVGQCKVLPLWNGKGTVKVIIINSDNQTASQEIIDKAFAYIESVRPIGATVTVTSPQPKLIDIHADVYGAVDNEAIKAAINKYFKNDGFSISYVSVAKIGEILLDAEGVTDYDYTTLTLNGDNKNIAINQDELPACGEVVLNVVT